MEVNSGSQLSFYILAQPPEVKKTGTTSPLSCLLFHSEVGSIMLVTRNIVVITSANATLIPASPVLSVGPHFDVGNRGGIWLVKVTDCMRKMQLVVPRHAAPPLLILAYVLRCGSWHSSSVVICEIHNPHHFPLP
jgi:hypothetical protein